MVDLLLARGYRVRVIDNLVGGREANLAHHGNEPAAVVRTSATSGGSSRAIPLFDGRDIRHSTSPASATSCRRSSGRPIIWSTNVQGTVRVLECARAAKVKKFVYAASSSCYGLAAVPTREDHPIAPRVSLRAEQISGRDRRRCTGTGLPAAGQFDPHFQRLRPARRARRAPTARCSACSSSRSSRASRSRWSATARSGAISFT